MTSSAAAAGAGGCTPGPVDDVLIPVYWHVRAIDAPPGVIGQWSNSATADTWRFVRDPADVTLLTPTPGPGRHDAGPELDAQGGRSDLPGHDPEVEQDDRGRRHAGRHLRHVLHADRGAQSRGRSVLLVRPGDRRQRRRQPGARRNPTRSFTVSAPTTDPA